MWSNIRKLGWKEQGQMHMVYTHCNVESGVEWGLGQKRDRERVSTRPCNGPGKGWWEQDWTSALAVKVGVNEQLSPISSTGWMCGLMEKVGESK